MQSKHLQSSVILPVAATAVFRRSLKDGGKKLVRDMQATKFAQSPD